MLRQKPANEAAIARLIDFLNDLWSSCQSDLKIPIAITLMQEKHGVAKRTFSDLKALGIIKQEEGKAIQWLDKNQPSRFMALKILDYRLKKTKKTIHVPIPEFAGIADSLKTIGERLEQLAVQNEKWLKTHKNGIKQAEGEADLFRVDDQELYITGQVASAAYSTLPPTFQLTEESVDTLNTNILTITRDLMNKLRNKE